MSFRLRFLCVIVKPRNAITDEPAPKNGAEDDEPTHKEPVYVVVFDSLIEDPARHEAVLDVMGEYLLQEYTEKKKTLNLPGIGFRKAALQLVVPSDMPQQKNYVECGVFLLHFAELFMTQPPTVCMLGVHARSTMHV